MRAVTKVQRSTISADLAASAYRLIAVAVLCGALAFLSESFFTLSNLLNVLRQASLVFLTASGLTIVIITAGIDLSIGATLGLSACVAGNVIKSTGSIPLGVAAGIAVGAAVGIFNGLMITLLRLPSFIATYGTLWMVQGITYWYTAATVIYGFPAQFRALGSGYLLGIPLPVYLMIAFWAVGGVLTRFTTYGRELYALGANPEATRLSGIPVRARLNLVYILSGIMAGVAAIVYLARLNSAEAGVGEPLTLPAIAAVLIGGTSLFGGTGSLTGTMIGAIILTLVLNGMNLLAVDAKWQPLVTGVIMVLAVWIDVVTRRRAEGRS